MFILPPTAYQIKLTADKGRGVFALQPIKSNTLVGDYLGKVLPYEQVSEEDWDYLMYLDDSKGIVADKTTHGVHLLNHSCTPNCTIRMYRGHTLFVALKDLAPNEELTISYRLAPQDSCSHCTHHCYCEKEHCTGTMHSQKTDYEKWRRLVKQQTQKYRPEIVIKEGFLQPLTTYPVFV